MLNESKNRLAKEETIRKRELSLNGNRKVNGGDQLSEKALQLSIIRIERIIRREWQAITRSNTKMNFINN